ncbi:MULTISPECIES: DUF1439 domain-containing protein [unclassified Acidovorax]|uniref:DUF1439 domain-containing protein n=1 Tax=unclassified Acidovorax TaxID=2684926 RepID=UPI002882EFFD|nr:MULTISPECIES: DUF1439 domain-containing protein [unclassified Acidovorax]
MQRRSLLFTVPAALFATLAGGGAAAAGPRYTVTREQIEEVLAERFPRRFPVGGLVELDVKSPRITLRPERNRLNADMAVQAGGPLLRRAYPGRLDVEFGLRYEASDRTVRAHDLQVNTLDFPDLRPDAAALLQQYAPQLARDSLREVVLHTLRPQDLALPDGLGLQPGAITVTERGLAVEMVPKPLS